MARIFSICFDYENAPHNAIINVRQTPFHTEYVLNVLDEKLQQQLPSNRLIVTPTGELIFPGVNMKQATPLMTTLTEAVAGHLELVQR